MRGESVEHVTYRSLSGRLADLRRKPRELNVCDNCGAFVYLNEDELAPPSDSELTELQSREPSKQSAGMLSVHNLAANAVGTDLVRFARCALRSVFPQPMGRTQGSFGCVSFGYPQAENEEPDVSLRADEPLRAGLLRVADDLIDPEIDKIVNSLPVLAFPKS
jgi:hypothetical protein